MVTPSLVMVGAPHFLSMTTLRPLGPSVTFTASASWSTPRWSESRASEWNCRIFGIAVLSSETPRAPPKLTGSPGRRAFQILGCAVLLLDDRENVTGREDEVLVRAVLDLGAAVLREDD